MVKISLQILKIHFYKQKTIQIKYIYYKFSHLIKTEFNLENFQKFKYDFVFNLNQYQSHTKDFELLYNRIL
jgi:hypothetical protein